MLIRYRMNKIVRLLSGGNEAEVMELISSDKYRDALLALEAVGSVRVTKAWGGEILKVFLLDSYAGYKLSRHDVWTNRLWGFVFGVATSVATAFITGILHI